jgi:DNA recombination protein RmuC
MPIEPAFIEAVKYDGGLFDYAFQQKIILVTPTTLLAILKTIESIWRYEKQNVNARKIADSATSVYNKLTGFVGDMEKIGKQLTTVNSSYDNAMSKLTTGRGNLISLATRFTELGVKVKKALPDTVVEDSGAIVHDDE